MGILNQQKLLKIVKGEYSPNKQQLESASKHDERMQIHSLPANQSSELKYYDEFLRFVGRIIDDGKMQVFKHLQSIPFETTEYIEANYREIEKIFNTQDRFIKHRFKSEANEQDFNTYLKKIKDSKFWKTTGMEILKSYLNSFIVVDYPSFNYYEEKGIPIPERPEPYYYPVHASDVLCLEISDDQDDSIEWIAFRDPNDKNKINVFDDKFVYVFTKQEKQEHTLDYTGEHGFSVCPVTSFYHIPFNKDSRIQKQGLTTKLFGSLDWLQIKITMTKHAELYSGFPITASYEEECDYQDPQGNQCDNGQVRTYQKAGLNTEKLEEVIVDCPKCNNNKNLGAGTHKIAPAMEDKDSPDLLEAMKFIQIPVEQLDRLENSISNQIEKIKVSMIGVLQSPTNQAMNKDQVGAGHEERQSILDQVRENFEQTHKFVFNRMAEIRYGDDYQDSIVNYGSKYFLYSTSQMMEQYLSLRKEGMPDFILDEVKNSIIENKFKNNPDGKNRMVILSKLMPYQNHSIDELVKINQINPQSIDSDLFVLKVNFNYFIDKFEREEMPVDLVLPFQSMERRISFINAKLLDYVSKQKEQNTTPAGLETPTN